MFIRLNKKEYELDNSAIAAIRYRAKYGSSAIEDLNTAIKLSENDPRIMLAVVERIIYEMIKGKKINYDKFKAYFEADSNNLQSALSCIQSLYKGFLRDKGGETKSKESFHEYKVLALMAEFNIPECLLHEVTIVELTNIISYYAEIKNTDAKPRKTYHKMSNDEIKNLYK